MIKISKEAFRSFVQTKDQESKALADFTEYYVQYLDQYQKTGKKTKWNWSAFSYGTLWLFYRKMYFYWLIGLLIILPLYIIGGTAVAKNSWGIVAILSVIVFSINIGFANYANYFYLRYAEEKISKGQKKSGVNNWVITLLIILFFVRLYVEPILEEVWGHTNVEALKLIQLFF